MKELRQRMVEAAKQTSRSSGQGPPTKIKTVWSGTPDPPKEVLVHHGTTLGELHQEIKLAYGHPVQGCLQVCVQGLQPTHYVQDPHAETIKDLPGFFAGRTRSSLS